MNRRTVVRGCGGIALGGATALSGCSTLIPGNNGGSDGEDTLTAAVWGKELWMSHKGEIRGTGDIHAIHYWPDGAWIDDHIEPHVDADNEDIELGDPLAELPIAEISAVLDGIRTWAVFALDLSTPDEINGNVPVDEDGRYYWYAAPTAFFDHVSVESEYTFRVATPGEYYGSGNHGRIIDIVD